MKKRILFIILFIFNIYSMLFAQGLALKVGDNPTTINSSALVDFESTTKGFLPPRMTNTQMMAIASPAKGLIVYCTDCTTEGIMQNTGTPTASNWIALGSNANQNNGGCPTVTTDCSIAGFSGTYTATVNSADRTFSVTLVNNTFNPTTIPFASTDLVLSSTDFLVSGLIVGTPTGAPALSGGSITLAAGQSVVVTYPFSGTVAGCGILKGAWKKVTLSCEKTTFVTNLTNCLAGFWSSPVSPSDQFGLTNNTAYSGTYSIPYTGGGCTLPAESQTLNGLTLTLTSTTPSTSASYAQNIVYTLGGTYNGTTGGSVTFTTSNGCKVIVGICITPAINMGGGTTANFLCHNLGANVTLDPHTPTVELVGAYVQFGKRGPTAPSGDSRYDWRSGVNDGLAGFAVPPTGSNPNSGTISNWASSPWAGPNAYSEYWSGGKTVQDPCPTGFRVPSYGNMQALINNNTVSRTGSWTTNPTNYGSAIHFGPNVSTKLITFPASGYINGGSGAIELRGSWGGYWLRDRLIENYQHYYFNFDGSTVGLPISGPTNGMSIRCIKHVN